MKHESNYYVFNQNEKKVILTDVGPWTDYLTITNDAERVVKRLKSYLNNRRLFYFDSAGDLTEILIKDGEFNGFEYNLNIKNVLKMGEE